MMLTLLISICAISVRANESGDLFTTIGQSHLPGVTVAPFKTGDTTINVNLDPYGYVYGFVTSSNGNKIKKPKTKLMKFLALFWRNKIIQTAKEGNGQ